MPPSALTVMLRQVVLYFCTSELGEVLRNDVPPSKLIFAELYGIVNRIRLLGLSLAVGVLHDYPRSSEPRDQAWLDKGFTFWTQAEEVKLIRVSTSTIS
ncbi:hypothetical protein VTK73DRAFT_807 [Phialemonium thermophilum]|uniref:Uncharacterized protein n=1 Tax=Phialemonium thermophilum TaxID=223376 RepID=A0ABR3XCV3_9PEZI